MKLVNSSGRYSANMQSYFHQKKLKLKKMVGEKKFVTLREGMVVEKKSPIVRGSRVIRIPRAKNVPYAFGQPKEDLGSVTDLQMVQLSIKESAMVVYVQWEQHSPTGEALEDLIALEDYEDWLKVNPIIAPTKIFKIDQVVYVKPSPKKAPSPDYPSIGSQWETDVKITEITTSKFDSTSKYRVYIPNVGYANFAEDELVVAADKLKYKYKDFKELTCTVDASPFFKKDEKVKTFDGHVYNMGETVIIKLNDELQQLLK